MQFPLPDGTSRDLELSEFEVLSVDGSFVVMHTGVMNRGAQSLTISIVPDSGTGELAGIAGSMGIQVVDGVHHYTLDYTLA